MPHMIVAFISISGDPYSRLVVAVFLLVLSSGMDSWVTSCRARALEKNERNHGSGFKIRKHMDRPTIKNSIAEVLSNIYRI